MLKALLVIAPLVLANNAAFAGAYGNMKCLDLAGDQLRAAQLIGWLNLSNRSADGQEISFENVQQDADQ
jgi:hypothetical protein